MPKLNAMEDFHRNISHRVLKQQDGHIALSATMEDKFHDIELKILVEENTLVIRSASIVFRKSPTPACRNIEARMEMLSGVTIGKGIEWKLKKALGCRNGCGNVLNLLQGLLPLALNYRAGAGVNDEREMLDAIHEQLLGTCAGYAAPRQNKEP